MILHTSIGKATSVLWLLILLPMADPAVLAEPPSVMKVGSFSAEKAVNPLPAHWDPFYFKDMDRHTDYRLVEEDGQVVVKATADASASGLIREIAIDPGEYPIVQWRWKIANILKKGNVFRKEGDDYPARLYILFEYDPDRLGFFEKLKYETAKLFYGPYPPWPPSAISGRPTDLREWSYPIPTPSGP